MAATDTERSTDLDLTETEDRPVPRGNLFDQLDRMFEQWTKGLPFRHVPTWTGVQLIPVDQYRKDGELVVRAEMPGLDPDEDVEITVVDGMLHIEAERREEKRTEEEGYVRRELRTGSFARTLPLPDGVTVDDVEATYEDGILEIHVPTPEPAAARKVPVTRA